MAFDVRYDSRLEHHLAVALLEVCRAFESTDVAVRVGAGWCRIIRADVEYHLADGLAEIEASRGLAEQLYQRLASDLSGDVFARYACARWHDGAGKISYRCG